MLALSAPPASPVELRRHPPTFSGSSLEPQPIRHRLPLFGGCKSPGKHGRGFPLHVQCFLLFLNTFFPLIVSLPGLTPQL